MKNLKVKIDDNSGFCFGVEFAIEMAEDILKTDKQLYCLGDIVHNDMEVERREKREDRRVTRRKKDFRGLLRTF